MWPTFARVQCRGYNRSMDNFTIGVIGQGWIGKNYADDFEKRGYRVVRYALEPAYAAYKDAIAQCDVVLIAVPTPTTPAGFDDSIVRAVVAHVGVGKIAVLKSTLLPGSTESIQKQYPDRIIMHSPEFLREANAAYDAAHPERNIIGVPEKSPKYADAARMVLAVLPHAPYELVCSAREAEYIKYAGNSFLYLKVMFANLMHDVVAADGCDWESVRAALGADSRIGASHLKVTHESRPGVTPGRGAGGHCFIKDFAALRELYERLLPNDMTGAAVFRANEAKNIQLLKSSGKDIDLLRGVYGDAAVDS